MGGDQQTLFHLYRSLIRLKLDYGCIVCRALRIANVSLILREG